MSSYKIKLFLFPTLMWAQELSGPSNPNNTDSRGKWEGLPSEGPGKIRGTGPGPGEHVSSLACQSLC